MASKSHVYSTKETYVPFHVQKAIADQKEKEKNMVSIQNTEKEYKTTEKIIKTGKTNSAVDKPNHPVLKALPLDFVK